MKSIEKKLAIITSGYIEDWLDSIYIDHDTYCTKFSGSWIFNYAECLRSRGIKTYIISPTRDKYRTSCLHYPTNAILLFIHPLLILQSNAYLKIVTILKRSSLQAQVLKNLYRFLNELYTSLLLVIKLREHCITHVLVQNYESTRFDTLSIIARLFQIKIYGTNTSYHIPSSGVILTTMRKISIALSCGLIITKGSEPSRVIRDYNIPQKRILSTFRPFRRKALIDFSKKHHYRRILGIPQNKVIAIYLGAIEMSYKGIDSLLSSWIRIFPDKYAKSDYLLIIAGDGSDSSKLVEYLNELKRADIMFRNKWITDLKSREILYAVADVFVFPSRHDNFGITYLEAMSHGLPVIAGKSASINDIFPDGEDSGALICDPDAGTCLDSALLALLTDADYRDQLSKKALTRLEHHDFDIDNTISRFISFIFES